MRTYNEFIDAANKKYYSLNFLLAEFEEVKNLKRDLATLTNRIECDFFETKDFCNKSYYKPISLCIKNFE